MCFDRKKYILQKGNGAVVPHRINTELFILEYKRNHSRIDNDNDTCNLIEHEMTDTRFEFFSPTLKFVDRLTISRIDMRGLVLVVLAFIVDGWGDNEEDNVDWAHNEGEDGEVAGYVEEVAENWHCDDSESYKSAADDFDVGWDAALQMVVSHRNSSYGQQTQNYRNQHRWKHFHRHKQQHAHKHSCQRYIHQHHVDYPTLYVSEQTVSHTCTWADYVEYWPNQCIDSVVSVKTPVNYASCPTSVV